MLKVDNKLYHKKRGEGSNPSPLWCLFGLSIQEGSAFGWLESMRFFCTRCTFAMKAVRRLLLRFMKKFGEKLRRLRQRHGLSQTELGQQLGVQQSYVGKLERGEKTPNVAMLGKIALLFQISFDQLLDDEVEVDG